MREDTLPPSYFHFMLRTAPIDRNVLKAVQLNNRNLPFNIDKLQQYANKVTPKGYITTNYIELLQPYIETIATGQHIVKPTLPIVPCEVIHPQVPLCSHMFVHSALRAAKSIAPVYLSLTFVPMIILQFWPMLRNPYKMISRGFLSSMRSTAFLSVFVTSYMSMICIQRRIMSRDHKLVYFILGLISSWSILIERKSRRSELALYVLPRALDSLYLSITDRINFPRIPQGESLLFALSMGLLMYSRHNTPEQMSPLLRRLLNFFVGDDKTSDKQHHIADANVKHHTSSSLQDTYNTLTLEQQFRLKSQHMKSSGSLHILPPLNETTNDLSNKHPAAINLHSNSSTDILTDDNSSIALEQSNNNK